MPKAELTAVVAPKCQALAERMGLELVDVSLDKEGAGKYLRIYIDKPEGISLDDIRRELASRHVIDHKVKQETMQ